MFLGPSVWFPDCIAVVAGSSVRLVPALPLGMGVAGLHRLIDVRDGQRTSGNATTRIPGPKPILRHDVP